MHRFKASKYKNSFAKVPKKEESLTDIRVETPLCLGNHVTAGAKFVACNIGTADSGKVGIFGVDATGRMGSQPSLPAHGAAVTDMQLSPFHHNMLLTASEDTTVKLWKIPDVGLSEGNVTNPVQTFSGFERRPELLQCHPVADDVVAVAVGSEIQVWNMGQAESILNHSCGSLVQSMSWSADGTSIACTTKDKALKVIDPRAKSVAEEGSAHGNHKDSRVVFLGDTQKLATTGFSNSRMRELKAWDQRNLKTCLQTLDHGSSTGILMPFYDADTKLLFLAGKGDSSLAILEVSDGPQLITQASQASLSDQTKGMALGSKLAVDVMNCEVDRLYQLCAKQLAPIRIEVPRRSHRDFAADLFPDTFSDHIVLTSDQWFQGQNAVRETTSLDPGKRKPLSSGDNPSVMSKSKETKTNDEVKHDNVPNDVNETQAKSTAAVHKPSESVQKPNQQEASKADAKSTKPKPFAGVRQSKFRHWTATVLHPSTHVTNLPSLSRNTSGACDGFHANRKYAAVPLSTPGGPIAIIDLGKVGRAPADLANFQNKAAITDFKWDPFDDREIAVGLDTGVVKIWNIPEEGLNDLDGNPNDVLEGHYSKILCLQYHPLAMDILATVSMDMNLIIWNLESNEMAIQLSGHEDEVLHMAWSEDGKYLATVSKDSKIRIYEPRESTYPIYTGPGPQGSRGARLVWVCDDKMLFVSGFTRQGARTVSIYAVEELGSGAKECLTFDKSPATLIPFYDSDTQVVFLTGKGDTLMTSCEVITEPPYLFPLASFNSDQMHQGFSFLPKLTCNVRKVEFARAWRLGKSSIEPVSFKVPRVKMEYFQDDIFPRTRDSSKASMTAEQWLNGRNVKAELVDLTPANMKPLSKAPKEAPKERKYESYNPVTYKTDEEKKDELLSAMSNKLDLDKGLEQDTMEGVDDDEWDD